MDSVEFAPGEVIYHEGVAADAVFVIEDGEVEVSSAAGGESVRLAVLGKGEIFGESGVLQDKPRSTTMTALTPVRATRLERDSFLTHFGADNPATLPLLRMLCGRLAQADRDMLAARTQPRSDAVAGEVVRLRLFGASDLTAHHIGEEGMALDSLPFYIGRRREGSRAPLVDRDRLSFHPGGDGSLSEEHFAVDVADGLVVVRDEGSRFGTIVNGRYISRHGGPTSAPLFLGVNDLIAGTKESPYRFRLLAE